MQYFISFLEGIITFISPCLLPMLPVYVSYFAGGGERTAVKTLKAALGFVIGFTAVFMMMGALAGSIGSVLKKYAAEVNIISGIIVVFFGMNFMGVFKLRWFGGVKTTLNMRTPGFFSAMLFGFIFSIGWTPCVGTFLGAALVMATQQGKVLSGMLMLLAYSAGLGVPFVVSAVLIEKMKSAFDFIKRNYNVINYVCGTILVIVGIMMATGIFGRMLSFFS